MFLPHKMDIFVKICPWNRNDFSHLKFNLHSDIKYLTHILNIIFIHTIFNNLQDFKHIIILLKCIYFKAN